MDDESSLSLQRTHIKDSGQETERKGLDFSTVSQAVVTR